MEKNIFYCQLNGHQGALITYCVTGGTSEAAESISQYLLNDYEEEFTPLSANKK